MKDQTRSIFRRVAMLPWKPLPFAEANGGRILVEAVCCELANERADKYARPVDAAQAKLSGRFFLGGEQEPVGIYPGAPCYRLANGLAFTRGRSWSDCRGCNAC